MKTIDTKRYTAMLKEVSINRRVQCEYCGAETVTITDPCFCSNCENILFDSVRASRASGKELMQRVQEASDLAETGDYEGALQEYSKIIVDYNEPQFHYQYALMHISYSNREVASIRYDRMGFMEENAKLREHASKLMSEAKRILNHASVMCEKSFKAGDYTPVAEHAAFMCYIKLSKFRSANRIKGFMQKRGSQFISRYADMVFYSSIGDYENSLASADMLLRRETFSINAAFYAALAALKLGNPRAAKEIASALEGLVKRDSLSALNNAIMEYDRLP
jgi:hypothetical protein